MLSFTDKGWSNYTEWEDEDRKTLKNIRAGLMIKIAWYILPMRGIIQLHLAKVITKKIKKFEKGKFFR